MTDHDLVVRGGTIADGRGGPCRSGDVAIRDGLIVAVGEVPGRGAREIDATGKLVTPGFVDVHTHYDGQAIWSDRLNPSSAHGVTTAVIGNCGVGFAPCRPEDRDLLVSVMEGVEDIPGVVMADGLGWDWETFPDYLDALERRARDIDVAALLPHSPLRVYVMGARGAARAAATEADLARMRRLAREAIDAGALGFATSRTFFHRTASGHAIPSYDSARDELEAIAMGLADAGSGIIQAVLDVPTRSWEAELHDLRVVAERSRRPATFTLGLPNEGPRLWDAAMTALEAANLGGVPITAQIFPRPIGMIAGLALSTNPFSLCPAYREIADLPLPARIAAMRDPDRRRRIVGEAPEEGHPLARMARDWRWMFPLGAAPDYEPSPDDSVEARAARAGTAPEETAYDLLLEQDGGGMLLIALGNFHEGRLDALVPIMEHPNVILGLGDGGAHYGMICDGSYPTFTLVHWVRDRAGSRLKVERVVRMLSHEPARAFGLHDRGILAPGYKADLNVIDLERLRLHAPEIHHDLPAGGRRLDQRADGYAFTIVSGEVIAADGIPTDARPGRLVRGARGMPEGAAA